MKSKFYFLIIEYVPRAMSSDLSLCLPSLSVSTFSLIEIQRLPSVSFLHWGFGIRYCGPLQHVLSDVFIQLVLPKAQIRID